MDGSGKICCPGCKNPDVRDTGGQEWTGHANYVCNSRSCAHEWVEFTEMRDPSKGQGFWDFMIDTVKKFRKPGV